MSDYIYTSDGELYHYGVPDMRWGVRRTPAQLGRKITKLNTKNDELKDTVKTLDKKTNVYEKRSRDMISKNSKWESKLQTASQNKAKYDLKTAKQLKKRNSNPEKLAKYMAKSSKYEQQMMKAEKKIKYNKYYVKAEETKNAAAKARSVIEKNDTLIKTYSNTLSAIDAGTVKQGRLFMQYLYDED